MATFFWTNTSTGDWSDPNNWSPLGVPSATDNATISGSGTLGISISSPQSVGTLALDDPNAIVALDSTLTVGTTLDLTAGAFDLKSDGTIVGGTIVGGGLVIAGGQLSGVTYVGELDVSATGLTVSNGITLLPSSGTGPGTLAVFGGGDVDFAGSQTLSNASLLMYDCNLRLLTGATLTLAPSITLTQLNRTRLYSPSVGANTTLINAGTILAAATSTYLSIGVDNFINQGGITASNGGSLSVSGSFTNQGTVTIANKASASFSSFANAAGASLAVGDYGAATLGSFSNAGAISVGYHARLYLGGSFSQTSLTALTNSGGTVFVSGTLNNTGGIFSTGASSPLGTVGLVGTIVGGTIVGNGLLIAGGELSGTTYVGDLDVSGSRLTVSKGITLLPSGRTGPGTLAVYGNGVVDFAGSQTLSNVSLLMYESNLGLLNGATLTLAPSVTLTQLGRTKLYSPFGIAGTTIINAGTILAAATSTYLSINVDKFINQGAITASNGVSLNVSSTFANQGAVTTTAKTSASFSNFANAAGGSLAVGDYSAATLSSFSNAGAISVGYHAKLYLGGSFSQSSFGALTNSGGTVFIAGTLNNTGNTLSTGASLPLGTVGLAGTIVGGTIVGGGLVAAGGELSGVTYVGELDVSGSRLTVNKGITLLPAGGTGPGMLAVYGYGTVYIGSQTLNNTSLMLSNGSLRLLAGATLTLTPSVTLTQQGRALLDSPFAGGGTVINAGTILATTPSSLSIGVDKFINQGAITASNGVSLTVTSTFTNQGAVTIATKASASLSSFANAASGLLAVGDYTVATLSSFSNQGSISVGYHARLYLGGSFSQSGFGALTNSGGTVFIAGTLNNTGGTLSTGASSPLGTVGLAGTIVGGTIVGGGLVAAGGELSGVTYVGELDVSGSRLTVSKGITLLPSGGTGPGTLAVDGGAVYLASQTLSNTSLMLLSYGNLRLLAGATLTLAPSVTLTQRGRALLDSPFTGGGTVINAGTILAAAPSSLSIGVDKFINQGAITASNGVSLTVTSTFTNQGAVTIATKASASLSSFANAAGGSLAVGDYTMATLSSFSNQGSISVGYHARLYLGGSFSQSGFGALTNSGGTVFIAGTLNNTGNTLSTGASSPLGTVGLAGTIVGGTIVGGGLVAAGGELSGVTYVGDLDVSASRLTVSKGITLLPSSGTGPGTLAVYGYGTVYLGSQTLNNTSLMLSNGNLRLLSGATLTLAPSVTLTQQGRAHLYAPSGGGTIINAGTILAAASSYLSISVDKFINQGGISASNGVSLNISGTFANQGAIALSAGATLTVSPAFTNTSQGVVTGNGAISGDFNNKGLIDAAGGVLRASGSITGAGSSRIEGGATLELAAGDTQGIVFGSAASGVLALGNDLAIAGTIYGVNVGTNGAQTNFIDIEGQQVSGKAGLTGSGTTAAVTLSDNAVLHLAGLTGLSPGETWHVNWAPDAAGTGTDVWLSDGGEYVWIGGVSSGWSKASNWQDLTLTGATTTAPGMRDSVTITAAPGISDTIIGPGSSARLTLAGQIRLSGQFATSLLTLDTAALLTLNSGDVLNVAGDADIGSSGQVVVTNGTLSLAGDLETASAASFSLNGGAVTVSGDYLSTSAQTTIAGGQFTIAGSYTAAALTVSGGQMTIGEDFSGSLNTVTGGSLRVGRNLLSNFLSIGGSGSVVVTGNVAGSQSYSVNGGTLTVGGTLTAFSPSLTASGGGRIQIAALREQNSTGNSAGSIVNFSADAASSLEIGAAGGAAAGVIAVDAGITLAEQGTITAPSITNNGTIIVRDQGMLSLTAPNFGSSPGGTGLTGSGQVLLGNNSTLVVGATDPASANSISFIGSSAILHFSTASLNGGIFAPKITDFGPSDVIDFDGSLTAASYAGGLLTLSNNGQIVGVLTLSTTIFGARFLTTPLSNGTVTQLSLVDSWINPQGGVWSDPANWSLGAPPGDNDSVSLPSNFDTQSALYTALHAAGQITSDAAGLSFYDTTLDFDEAAITSVNLGDATAGTQHIVPRLDIPANTLNTETLTFLDPQAEVHLGGPKAILAAITVTFQGTQNLLYGAGTADLTTIVGAGTIMADGGTLELTEAIAAPTSVAFQIGAGSVLQLDQEVSAGNSFQFLGTAGTLTLGADFAFQGTIDGMQVEAGGAVTTVIDLKNITTTVVSVTGQGTTGGTITMSDDTVLTLAGIGGTNWMAATAPDGGFGTDLFLVAGSLPPVPPPPVSGIGLAAGSDSGVPGDSITNITAPTLAGTGIAGDTVHLFDGSTEIGSALVGDDGLWAVATGGLSEGIHSLSATQSDATGTSGPAIAFTLVIDTTAPTPAVTALLATAQGKTVTIGPAVLQFIDAVSGDAGETYSVTTGPASGTLLDGGATVTSFTQADIDNGLLAYAETAIGVTSDAFAFTVSDAAGNTTGVRSLPIAIRQPPVQSPVVLNDFGWAQGWGSPDNPRITADTDGNGTIDYIGFGFQTVFIDYGGTFSDGQGHLGPGFTGVTVAVNDFGTAEGYTADVQRGVAATGAGPGDTIYGQGFLGVYWYAATAGTPTQDAAGHPYDVLQYQSSPNLYANFGSQEGWTPSNGFQVVKAGAADAYASILGFGQDGIVVGPQAFAPDASAAAAYVIPFGAGNASGWSQQVDVRTFTDTSGNALDLNHDGITDFVGMGPQGLVYAFGSETGGTYGLGALTTAEIGVNGGGPDLGEAQGWNDATTLRNIVEDPQTGFDDVLAFGAAGVYVAMGQDPATHGGQAFGQLYLAMSDFGSNQGWSVQQTPRIVGDVNGDGIPDIVGFGANATFAAIGSRDAQGNLHFALDQGQIINDFGFNEAWSGTDPQTVRTLGDVNGSGRSDLILSGAFNTQIWQFG